MTKVMIFAEDQNDAHAIKIIIKHLEPHVAVSIRRDPIVLSRNATRPKLGNMYNKMAAFAKAEALGGIKVVVVAHRDCDSCEPAHEPNSAELEREMKAAGITHPVAATPAWEIEAWWMLVPEALAATRGCWKTVNFANKNVGDIANAKQVLRTALRPTGIAAKRCPDYTESDSQRIAEESVRLGLVPSRFETCQSFKIFKKSLSAAVNK